jgi:Ca2+-binding EF-hand superfamily protein
MKRGIALGPVIGCTIVLCAALPAWQTSAAPARSSPAAALQRLDVDHDGTVDLNEAKMAATALFDRLDSDHDGTLDRRELRGRLSGRQFAAADPDHDGTLSRDEYLAVVEMRFAAVDSDHDGTLDAKELNSPAGQAFLRLTM